MNFKDLATRLNTRATELRAKATTLRSAGTDEQKACYETWKVTNQNYIDARNSANETNMKMASSC
jgi:hypothetical protein